MRTLLRSISPAMLAATTGLTYMTFLPAAQAGTPITLTATPALQQSAPDVVLTWTGASATAQYLVYRDAHMLSAASGGTYTDTHVHGGETHRYLVVELRPKIGTSNTATVSVPVPAPASPSNLTGSGSWDATRSIPTVHLAWSAVTGAITYNVYRDGSLLQAGTPGTTLLAPATGFTDSAVTSGHTYTYTVTAVGPGGESARSAAASVTAPNPPTPPAPATPTGLTAAGVWDPDCVECNNMAMPEVDLSWQASPGATGYKVYRNGVLLQSGVPAATFEDMTVASGQAYAYTVAATGPGGASGQSSPASATAPNPPPPATGTGTALTAPTNLGVHGFWLGGASDTLTWDPAPQAASYNVYAYDVPIARGVTATNYTIPFASYQGGITYTVTAVDGMGMESLPCPPATAMGAIDPASPPPWLSNTVPSTPNGLVATPDWNLGQPRICVLWHGADTSYYNVYRDGRLVAKDFFGLTYIDSHVFPGETHSYTASAVNVYWPGKVESPQSAPVTATALASAPAPIPGKLQITRVVRNDDSAVIFFQPVPGAADYRLYDASNPAKVKYAGVRPVFTNPSDPATPYSIEWNGIDPTNGANLVLEAVDKLGPFQKMDGAMGPGAMTMAGMSTATNGQGDPSNVPVALAASDPFHVACAPLALTGGQAFLDTFRGEQPLTPVTTLDPAIAAINASGHPIQEQENDKWRIRTYDADNVMTRAFFMNNHFMDTLYDGPFAQHNNNASLVMMPKATADISGGKVLHVTFEVDAHFNGRRWCDLMVGEAGDTLTNPGKFDPNNNGGLGGNPGTFPTVNGSLLRWELHDAGHGIQLYTGGTRNDIFQPTDWNDAQTMNRMDNDGSTPKTNGTTQDLDKRHKFDLYLSQTRYRIVETTPDGAYCLTRDKAFPAGLTLPFSRCQVYFVHELYHTGNDRPENVTWRPYDSYWYNDRPWSDERHWDNMGFEVLNAFPPPAQPTSAQ